MVYAQKTDWRQSFLLVTTVGHVLGPSTSHHPAHSTLRFVEWPSLALLGISQTLADDPVFLAAVQLSQFVTLTWLRFFCDCRLEMPLDDGQLVEALRFFV